MKYCMYCKTRIVDYRNVCDACMSEIEIENNILDMERTKVLDKVEITSDETTKAFEDFKYAHKETSLKVSETLIIGFDMSGDEDLSALSVSRCKGSKIEHVNTFYGEEAEWMYGRLNTIHPINDSITPMYASEDWKKLLEKERNK